RSHGNPTPPPPRSAMLVQGSFSGEIVERLSTNPLASLGQGSTTLQFNVDGKSHKPFTRFGVQASTKQETTELTLIRIVVMDDAGDLRWIVKFWIDPYRVSAGHLTMELKSFDVEASLTQDEPNTPKAQVRWGLQNRGTLELTQVSTNIGGTISEKFKIN